jgi:hypothetical protein
MIQGKIVIILNSKNEISGEEEYNEQLLNITQGNDGISSTHLIIFGAASVLMFVASLAHLLDMFEYGTDNNLNWSCLYVALCTIMLYLVFINFSLYCDVNKLEESECNTCLKD